MAGKKTRAVLVILWLLMLAACNPFDFGACDGEPVENGNRKYYYPDRRLQSEVEVKGCQGNGRVIEYYPNGGLKAVGMMQNGQDVGDRVLFDSSGLAVSRQTWKENRVVLVSLISNKHRCSFEPRTGRISFDEPHFDTTIGPRNLHQSDYLFLEDAEGVRLVNEDSVLITIPAKYGFGPGEG